MACSCPTLKLFNWENKNVHKIIIILKDHRNAMVKTSLTLNCLTLYTVYNKLPHGEKLQYV